jgi:Ser/Thr protein kinase RdoA (MazF antagonist)
VRGRFSKSHVRHRLHYEALGETMARLHNHASRWTPPPSFTRRKWDWDGFFGEGAGLGEGREAWSLLPREHRALFERVAQHTRHVMDELGEGPQAWGLIHADLHWNNVLLSGGVARPIDFDDCGWGYWAYDFAVVLGRHVLDETSQALAERQSFERGYARHRPLPHDQLAHLKSFAAARSAALTLWVASRARDNPAFRERLPLRLDHTSQHCKLLLKLQ